MSNAKRVSRKARQVVKAAASKLTPAKRRTQAQRSEATRKLLLDATVDVLAKQGVTGLRMRDIERQAGVSRGALLHHFPTKQDMILAAFEYVNERSLERSRHRTQFAQRARNIEETIDAVVVDASDFFFGPGFVVEFAVAFDQANSALRGPLRRASRSARFSAEASWCRALESHGLPSDIASDIVNLTLNTVRGFFVRRFLDDNPSQRTHLMNVWRDMIRYYLINRLSHDRPAKAVLDLNALIKPAGRPAVEMTAMGTRLLDGPIGLRKFTKPAK